MKLDHIYRGTGSGDIGQVEQDLNNLTNRVNTLSNITAKTNVAQTFEGNQTFNGSLVLNQPNIANGNKLVICNQDTTTILEATSQNQKRMYLDFIQPTSGFRNYSSLEMRVKNGSNANFATVMKLESRNTDQGLYMSCENNKLNFLSNTQVSGVATPVNNMDAVNKQYVDSRTTTKTIYNLKQVTTSGSIPTTEQTATSAPSNFFENDKDYTVLLTMNVESDKKVVKSFKFRQFSATNWWCSDTFRVDGALTIGSTAREYKIIIGATSATANKFKIEQSGGSPLTLTGWRLDIIKES